jgi:glucosylceramidase
MKHCIVLGLILMMGACTTPQNRTVEKVSTKAQAVFDPQGKTVTVYTTAAHTDYRLSATDTLSFKSFGQPLETQACIFVDPGHTFQTFLGIGGAITDAAAETFYRLPKIAQQKILTAYYDSTNGIGYTLARTNIGSCDFSSDSYGYVSDGDTALRTFSVAHDEKYKIPLIKAATKQTGGELTLFASPWSPPAWMKDNNDLLHGGHLKPDKYSVWANYFVKFIRAYQQDSVSVWGITVQNEPMAVQRWESCIYTAQEERDFIKHYLGPTFQQTGLKNKKIIAWDHNRGLLYQRASTILNDPQAAQYVWGIGFHWYVHDNFDNVKRVSEAFPDTHLLFTEGCNGPFDMSKISQWQWGENYARSMVHDFNNGAVGWTDWNILLDQQGGPNHVKNFCFAPIHGDVNTGQLYFMNSYYYIGHFSKFIRPGARRIISSSNRDGLQTTAFINPSGKIAIVVLNLSDEKIPFQLWIKGQAAGAVSLPHSIITLVVS